MKYVSVPREAPVIRSVAGGNQLIANGTFQVLTEASKFFSFLTFRMEPTWWLDSEFLDISELPSDMNFVVPPAHPPAGQFFSRLPAASGPATTYLPAGPGLANPPPGPGLTHPPPGPGGNPEPGPLPEPPRRRYVPRAQQAYDQCWLRKAKCDEGRPSCGSCRHTGTVCLYQESAPYCHSKGN
jgi:hypothetical protein